MMRMMKEMVATWVETRVSLDVPNDQKGTLRLENVKALKNSLTGKVLMYPWEVSKAEMGTIAKDVGVEPRDVATFLLLSAKPGPFKAGEVLFKYHLQKMLFYLWKTGEKEGYYDGIPVDDFKSAKNGPVPIHIDDDLERFAKNGLVKIKLEKTNAHKSKRITLTEKGEKLASQILIKTPEEYRTLAIEVKKEIFALEPEEVRERVHEEYPEYKNSYVENDIE